MLTQLLIRNFALAEELVLRLGEGLTVLTGETGAGKSLTVDAVAFLLGARADRDSIRFGCERAYVEGIFKLAPDAAALRFLEEQELGAGGEEVILSRELSQSGRSLSRIDGVAVSLTQLRQFTALLMDIHGQHEHQSLLDEGRHLAFLDGQGDPRFQEMLKAVELAWERATEAGKALESLRRQGREIRERAEEQERAVQELSAAKLVAGEEEALRKEATRLRNAHRIMQALDAAYSLLYAGERDESAHARAHKAAGALADISALDAAYGELAGRTETLYFELEDLSLALRMQRDRLDADAQRLEAAEERLDLLRRLERRYAKSSAELIGYLEELKRERETAASLAEQEEAAAARAEEALRKYRDLAAELSAARKEAALRLQAAMEARLAELNMAGTRFTVLLEQEPGLLSPRGFDRVRFLLAPNAGEEARPLAKIASGGELSRLMLAFKSLAASRSGVPSMVFDEIDSGISGHTAQVVAEKLWQAARDRQVLCVTHLHQIAAMGSSHLLVEKREKDGRTAVAVLALDEGQRAAEIARLLGGSGGASGLAHAKALLTAARRFRSAQEG